MVQLLEYHKYALRLLKMQTCAVNLFPKICQDEEARDSIDSD